MARLVAGGEELGLETKTTFAEAVPGGCSWDEQLTLCLKVRLVAVEAHWREVGVRSRVYANVQGGLNPVCGSKTGLASMHAVRRGHENPTKFCTPWGPATDRAPFMCSSAVRVHPAAAITKCSASAALSQSSSALGILKHLRVLSGSVLSHYQALTHQPSSRSSQLG